MLTRADFCVYSVSGYKGHMVCPKNCSHQGYCSCEEAVERFRQALRNKNKNQFNKNRRYR